MESFLRGLLRDLERRSVVLRDRLAAIPVDAEIRPYSLAAYQVVERVRREAAHLLADPALQQSALLSNHLQLYRRWDETATLVEHYHLPFLERYTAQDRQLTRLCHRMAQQIGWPLSPPLVATFSNQYYWTLASFNLVCAPATEVASLLGLPDLCHELGHILLEHDRAVLIGDFEQELVTHFKREQALAARQQRPPQYQQQYDRLIALWLDQWILEFVSDIVAVYLVGPAFGWQHARLCARFRDPAYYPALGEEATHPSPEARLRAVVAVLQRMGAPDAAQQVRSLWDRYVNVSGETLPAEHDSCYPQVLVDSLARRTIDGCRALGLRSFTEIGDADGDILGLVAQAWEQFGQSPDLVAGWEQERLAELWSELGA